MNIFSMLISRIQNRALARKGYSGYYISFYSKELKKAY